MKIIVSACLAGENCKYNGGNNQNERIMKLMAGNEVVTVCPEQMGGLTTPRIPSEIRDGIVTAKEPLGEIGTCFLYRVTIGFQGIGIHARQQLSTSMS